MNFIYLNGCKVGTLDGELTESVKGNICEQYQAVMSSKHRDLDEWHYFFTPRRDFWKRYNAAREFNDNDNEFHMR